MVAFNWVKENLVLGCIVRLKKLIEDEDIEIAKKEARRYKLKLCDWSRNEWWFHQWHSVFEIVEFDLRRDLIDSAYEMLEQAEFQLSITEPSFSKVSVKQSKA